MTAYATGTASSHTAAFTALKTHLTSHADLTGNDEEWVQVWSAGSGNAVVLKGPGLSETDEVFIGMELVSDPANDSYAIHMRGMTGIIPSATALSGHINVSKPVVTYLDSQPFTYWFVASGRRFACVFKISTVFEAMYGGLFLPYATPLSYPYPLFVGGSAGTNVTNWRSVEDAHTHFVSPFYQSLPLRESGAWVLDPSSQWVRCWNRGTDPGNPKVAMAPEQFLPGLGVAQEAELGKYGYNLTRERTAACYGGAFALTDITLVQAVPTDQSYGVLDGCYRVPGNGNSSENIVTVDGVDHLVVQNVFRTGQDEYWALALD